MIVESLVLLSFQKNCLNYVDNMDIEQACSNVDFVSLATAIQGVITRFTQKIESFIECQGGGKNQSTQSYFQNR